MYRVLLVFGLLLATAGTAYAGSPHFVGDPTFTVSGRTVTVSGKEAGLGNEEQIHVVLTATAECINGGGNHPKASNKTSITAAGDFPVQNGHSDWSLSGTAVFDPDPAGACGTVRISDVQVCDETNGICARP